MLPLDYENIFKYIRKTKYDWGTNYTVHKVIDGVNNHFYHNKSLIGALVNRDLLMRADWDYDLWVEFEDLDYTYIPELLPRYEDTRKPEKLKNIYQRSDERGWWIGKNTLYYGSFKTLKEAEKHRDMLDETGWRASFYIPRSTENKYIRRNNRNGFCVQKKINGKSKTLKCSNDYEYIRRYRDLLVENNWNKEKVEEVMTDG